MTQDQKASVDWKSFRAISIMDVLERLGHAPVKTTGKEAWFLSPLRSANNASFKVSLIKNRWYDFGIGKGGTVIDLIMHMRSCRAWEAVEFLLTGSGDMKAIPPKEHQVAENAIKIMKVSPLRHRALLEYLNSRGIPFKVARRYCREVDYKMRGKSYFAIGLQNFKGGWELRNKYFKNSSSPKYYSLIERESEQILVTEGMFDFLSLNLLETELVEVSDCLVLNSVSFISDIIPLLSRYKKVLLYLDNDPAGRNATSVIWSKFSTAQDRSGCYSSFLDPNECLLNEKR